MRIEQFSAWANILPDPLLLVSHDGRVLAANVAVLRLLGCSNETLVGRRLIELVDQPADAVARYLQLAIATRQPIPELLTFRLADGTPLQCRCDSAALVFPDTVRPEQILMRLRPRSATLERFKLLDGTLQIERLAQEIERRKEAEKSLRDERELLRITLASIGDAVIATDIHGRVTFLNAAAAALTGWADEAVGQKLDGMFRILNEETGRAAENPVERALHEGAIVGLANHHLLLTKDGRQIPIDHTAAPIRDGSGGVIGAVLVCRDISARREAEERLQESYRRLEARIAERTADLVTANRAKDEFLMTLSHELRTPLTPLISALQILAADKSLNSKSSAMVQLADRNARAQARLVDDLLDLSGILSGKLAFRFAALDVAGLLNEAVESVRQLAEAKQIRLSLTTRPEARVNGDPDRLRQVFWNLLSNAVKFTGRDGVVNVQLHKTDSVEILVTDTGIGIPPEFISQLFDKFTQADSSLKRPYGGLGLGLSISRYIVEAHGGRIEAESRGKGHGATFRVILPAGDPQQPR